MAYSIHHPRPSSSESVAPLYQANYWVTSAGTPAAQSQRFVEEVAIKGGRAAVKRLVDVGVSLFLIVLLLPTLAAIFLAIRWYSHGSPALLRQQRVGRNGRLFILLKFRTARWDAGKPGPRDDEVARISIRDALKSGLRGQDEIEASLLSERRLTPLGRWLRANGLDELPQLLNVLKGDMSLVGPRPRFEDEIVDHWAEEDYRLLLIRPGLTGLSQISPSATNSHGRVSVLDDYYLDHWSLGLDGAILARTLTHTIAGFDA